MSESHTNSSTTAWPELSEEVDAERCQDTYRSLLTALETNLCNTSRIFQELKYTSSCDHDHDLSHLRRQFEKRMTSKALSNILNHSADKKDIEEGESAIYHNLAWSKSEVFKALTTKYKIGFTSYFNFDKWVIGSAATLGLFAITKRIYRFKRAHTR